MAATYYEPLKAFYRRYSLELAVDVNKERALSDGEMVLKDAEAFYKYMIEVLD